MNVDTSVPLTLDEVTSRLDDAVLSSPADATEVVWIEVRRSRVGHRLRKAAGSRVLERSIIVRVVEGRRIGVYRTDCGERGELRSAVRQAIAASRIADPAPSPLLLPGPSEPEPAPVEIADEAVQGLTPERAGELLRRGCGRGVALLEWLDGVVAIANSLELRRSTPVTALDLWVRAGRGSLAGSAGRSSRFLDRLSVEEVVAQARGREAQAGIAELDSAALPLVLAPEAVIGILGCLLDAAFTARSFRSGRSFLRQHMGVQVFDRVLTLVDDATRPEGLPFPFDLEGRTKQPVELVVTGVPRTPTLDLRSAAELALAPTGHGLASDDARASNLFLEPGSFSEAELLQAAGDGVWGGRIRHVECVDPSRVQIRARIEGARRIRHGSLAEALPPLVWEDSLLRAFSSIGGLSRETTIRAERDPLLGGISAPAILVDEAPLSTRGSTRS